MRCDQVVVGKTGLCNRVSVSFLVSVGWFPEQTDYFKLKFRSHFIHPRSIRYDQRHRRVLEMIGLKGVMDVEGDCWSRAHRPRMPGVLD